MKFSPALAAALFLPVLVNAQTTTFTVTVGPEPTYNPSEFTVSIGTIVEFDFTPDAFHSVTQGSKDQQCNYSGGFDSGVQTAPKTFQVPITDNNTIYFHCKVFGHCFFDGMKGVINPLPTGNTFDTDTGPVMGEVGQKPL